jgi:hypothetical protein
MPEGRSAAVQTPDSGTVVGSRRCEVCRAALRGGQQVACSDRCRARRWRERQTATREDRDRQLVAVTRDSDRLASAAGG